MLKKTVQQGPPNFLYLFLEERARPPLLRASNGHILIVRVLRVKRAPGRSSLHAGGFFKNPERGSYLRGRVKRKTAPSCCRRGSQNISFRGIVYLRIQFG